MNIISPAIILSRLLIDTLSIFSDPTDLENWPLFVKNLPDGREVKSNAASVIDTTGVLDGRIMSTGKVIEHLGIQFLIRSIDYSVGFSKGEEIKTAMELVRNTTVTIDTVPYIVLNVRRTTSLVPIQTEDGTKRRALFTLNFLISMKEA